MHASQRNFCERVRDQFPAWFRHKSVLDCGSLDINGNNRFLFDKCVYTGIDIGGGKNVDIISPIHLVGGQYDVVISTECFEHDRDYKRSLKHIVSTLLKPRGLFIFTCATEGRKEHGTNESEPHDSPYTRGYYKNLTMHDVLPYIGWWPRFSFEVNNEHHDLYFWGVR